MQDVHIKKEGILVELLTLLYEMGIKLNLGNTLDIDVAAVRVLAKTTLPKVTAIRARSTPPSSFVSAMNITLIRGSAESEHEERHQPRKDCSVLPGCSSLVSTMPTRRRQEKRRQVHVDELLLVTIIQECAKSEYVERRQPRQDCFVLPGCSFSTFTMPARHRQENLLRDWRKRRKLCFVQSVAQMRPR
jgi:hypothetical protein